MAQCVDAIMGMEWLNCPASSAAVNPRDTAGFHAAEATANAIRINAQFPGHARKDPPILPASATAHREKKMTAATGAPQRRAKFRTGSMPATISTEIRPTPADHGNLNL